MSITAEKGHQKPFHRRHKNSGELDVFEAAGYFSGANEMYGTSLTTQQKMARTSGRMSVDIPVMSSKRSSIPAPTHHHQKSIKDEKKHNKQPSSPGGKLASFLNSLFNQISSEKKKSKTSSTQSMKDDFDHEISRRKRRSSISHFPSDSKSSSFYSSSSSSEFKKAPQANTSTKNSFQSHSDNTNPDVMMSTSSKINNNNNNVHAKSSISHKKVYVDENTKKNLDKEKFKFCTSNQFSISEKYNTSVTGVSSDKIDHLEDLANLRNFINDEDDGADSDSSSDLFELPNYDLVSLYSSDLPVYETTHVDGIKRGAPIASGAI